MIILATVRCGHCKAEGRREMGMLGEKVKHSDGVVMWYAVDRRVRRARRKARGEQTRWSGGQVLEHPTVAFRLPDDVFAYCRVHGPGRVSTGDVIAARGTTVLTFKAPV